MSSPPKNHPRPGARVSKGEPSQPGKASKPDQARAAGPKTLAPLTPLAPGLYLVATPIGNLGDMTQRGLEALASADLIAAEDTRSALRLLAAFGLKAKKLLAYHDLSAPKVRAEIIKHLKCGAAVALISEAGAPLISDPGYKLVQAALEQEITVTALPGATAVITALQLSGLPSDRFFFQGFLPPKSGARKAVLSALTQVPGSLIFFETGPRLTASLQDMQAVLGNRPAALARELTKRFEEVRRGTLSELLDQIAADPPRGELVVVLGPAAEASEPDPQALESALRQALKTMSLRDAVAAVAATEARPRGEVYRLALALKDQD